MIHGGIAVKILLIQGKPNSKFIICKEIANIFHRKLKQMKINQTITCKN